MASLLGFACEALSAGGPRFIAGSDYFDPGVVGQPVHWTQGLVKYFVDQGPLNDSISHEQAVAMIDSAAGIWSAVATAGVTLTNEGTLNEDVNGTNTIASARGQFSQPADVTPSSTTYPVAVIFDADGSVIDALYGKGASDPTSCQNNGVLVQIDNINTNATFAHAFILLNGNCATNSKLVDMMSFELERAFGLILGFDYSQVNHDLLEMNQPGARDGWPVMQPLSGLCTPSGGTCIPNPTVLRYDDIAALNRLYPISSQNLSLFPGKVITASNTISIHGSVSFRNGSGMQGVNVVVRPLDADGNPMLQYTVSAVSGATFNGDRGNPATGYSDADGISLSRWGSNDPGLQGAVDLSGIPLPPGVAAANYEVTFEAIDPLFILGNSVGPYRRGQVVPSGTLQPILLTNLTAGSMQMFNLVVDDSAAGGYQDAIGTEAAPRPLPASGMWVGRISQLDQTDWLMLPVRANHTFTVVTQATDESGAPTGSKALPSIGVWDGFKPLGSASVVAVPGLNGSAVGETWLHVTASADDLVRVGIADLRGDGRPDYRYNGWVLYADTVQPQRIPSSGAPIVIHGMGFREGDTVLINGQPAAVTSITPNEITAIAPAAGIGVSGTVDIEVDDQPVFYAQAVITGGISYDAGTGDALTLIKAPANTVPMNTPLPFTVRALDSSLSPAGGVTVTFAVSSGNAILACGSPVCGIVASGDGAASINVIATDATPAIVTASLCDGSSLQAHFVGGTPPVLSSLTPRLSLAAGASFTWTVQALALLSNGSPAVGQTVTWQSGVPGIAIAGPNSAQTGADGIAAKTLTVGLLNEGQSASISACLNGTSQCVTYSAFGARPEFAELRAVSGTVQDTNVNATPLPVTMRLLDMNGNAMAGGTVSLFQALYAWAPSCTPHVPCISGVLLSAQSAVATSDLNGLVTFSPLTLPGVATNLQAFAVTGNTAILPVEIEQHP